MVQLVEDAVENRKVKRLVGQFSGVGDPSDDVRLQHRHVALNGVLVQDREGRLRQFPRPLRRRSLSQQTKKQINCNRIKRTSHRFNLSRALGGSEEEEDEEEYLILFPENPASSKQHYKTSAASSPHCSRIYISRGLVGIFCIRCKT